MASCLPYGFYKTELATGYLEYRSLEIIAAVNHNNYDNIIILKPPTFTSINSEFLSLFRGLLVQGEEKQKLSKEVAELFKEITYDGKIGELENSNPNICSFELWHGNLSWAIIDVIFEENLLSRIEVKSGVKRGRMVDGYRRKKNL